MGTAKEFRDAIESLSPEQQAFAKAFRSMQLDSSLFAVCVIQIKPQLEKLLNLPDDSLTKQIQLTQRLEKLFIQYQIPSDLLSYAGDPDASEEHKINVVSAQVQAMLDLIDQEEKSQLEQKKLKEQFLRGPPPPPGYGGYPPPLPPGYGGY